MGKNGSKHIKHTTKYEEEKDNREYHMSEEQIAVMLDRRKAWNSEPCPLVDLFQEIEKNSLWECFKLKDLLAASRICKRIWVIVADYLENNYYYKPTYRSVQYYTPHKIISSISRHTSYFSPFLTHIFFYGLFQKLTNLPPTLISLKISLYGFQPIIFPDSLKILTIESFLQEAHLSYYGIKETITVKEFFSRLPPSLSSLNFGSGLEIIFSLPPSITDLTILSGYSNHEISLPPSLSRLTLGNIFPSSILPSSLSYLDISMISNSVNFTHSLPPSITELKMPIHYNGTIDNLPSSLKSLSMLGNQVFDQLLDNLPSSLSELFLSSNYSRPLSHLPHSLSKLYLRGNYSTLLNELPPNLKSLSLASQYNLSLDFLPPSLEILQVGSQFNQTINHLPLKLTHLHLGNNFNHPIDSLPPFLKYLSFHYNQVFNHPVDKLPPNLYSLIMECPNFNHPINSLPLSLKHLDISFASPYLPELFTKFVFYEPPYIEQMPHAIYSHPVLSLPPYLTTLILTNHFNLPLPTLPNSITLLKLGKYFNQPISSLPSSLHRVFLGKGFNKLLPPLPDTLADLALGHPTYSHPITFPPCLSFLLISPFYPHPIPKSEWLRVAWL